MDGVKLQKMDKDGNWVEHTLTDIEQVLMEKLAFEAVLHRAAYKAYRSSNLRFYASLLCNVALLVVLFVR